ncbi:IclR family transcriptional regulator [Corynebacterium sp. L4756]|uniref:IclR family transcriptional regulator n=1 Tax=unclassified Corynebacterium TaxID=2624378 RepID=UPI00374DDBB2
MANTPESPSLEGPASKQRGSVEKAIDILAAFQNHPSGLGVSEVARLTKLPKTTSHRLLNTLATRGALERSGDIFRLGPVIFDIVSSTSNSVRANLISEEVTPFLASLFEQTRHTVHLAYLEGNDVAYANKLFSTKRLNSPSRIGGRAPSYCTGVGKVLLAHDPARAEMVLERELTPWTPYTITDPADLRAELVNIRNDGIAFDRQEISLGLSCVAAPVFGLENRAVAALSVSSPSDKFAPEELIPPLQRVAAAAGRAVREHQKSQEML